MIGIIKSSIDQLSSKALVDTPTDVPSLMKALGQMCGDLSVLLVDDEPEILITCQALLRRFFGRVDTASNGQEALDIILNGNNHYDIVITDINMPVMNGYKMSLKLRELKPDIAIIVLSAHAESSYLLDFIAIDVDGYCSKPVDGYSLFQAIYKVVSRIFYIKVCEKNTHYLLTHNRFSFAQELMDNIAHQWRQPLSIISCQINDIFYSGEKLSQPVEETLNKISHTLGHLSQTINAFASLYEVATTKEIITLRVLFEDILLMFGDLMREKNIALSVENKYPECKVYASKQHLTDALMNILSNSIDIFKERGVVDPKIVCTIDSSDDMMVLRICDNGGGFSEEMLEKAFDPYSTTKHKARNTGLGLYIARLNIQDNEGTIVASNCDGGACLEITFPFAKEEN